MLPLRDKMTLCRARQKRTPLLLAGVFLFAFLAACGSSSVTDGGGGSCIGATCLGGGGGGGGGGPAPDAPSISIAAVDGENILTLTPPSGSTATTFNIYSSPTHLFTTTTGTKIASATTTNPFHHTGLTNGTPVFYIATVASGSSESSPSAVVGGMPGKWTQLCSAAPCSSSLPPPRDSHTAVYNSTSKRMMIFGGKDQSATFQDLWKLTNANGNPVWNQQAPNLPPSARAGHTAVYSQSDNKMIVFGGSEDKDGNTLRNDLWRLANADAIPVSPSWENPSIVGPSNRWGHAAVYDELKDIMIVFGGVQTGTALFRDVWILTNATQGNPPTWTQVNNLTGTPPSSRCCVAVGYDAATRRMIIFGGFAGFGQGGTATLLNDLWTLTFNSNFDAATWQQLTASGGSIPSARCCGASFWDGNKLLLFGGGTFSTSSDDKLYALVLGLTTFASADGPNGGPAARTFGTAVPAGLFLLFGGSSASGPLNDLWRLE